MIKSDDLRFFLTIAEEASLAAAARRLNVTSSAVSQRLMGLERHFGLRLTHRNGRSMILTDEGRLLAERGRRIIADMDGLSEDLIDRRGVVSGHLRILAPFGFGRIHIAPLCLAFQDQHPEVTIDLALVDRLGRHPDQAWDVAIHVGELPDSSLRVKTLAPNRRLLCASPAYLARRGTPQTPADLRDHDCIVLRENDEDASLWRFTRAKMTASVRIAPCLSSNDGSIVRDWAIAGRGIAIRSEWDVAQDIREGRLVALLPDHNLARADVVLFAGSSAAIAGRTRSFIDYLSLKLAHPPWMA